MKARTKQWLLFFSVVASTLLMLEFVLWVTGFQYVAGVRQFAYPNTHEWSEFVLDTELFWRLKPSEAGANSLGFPGPEIQVHKPAGVFRVLFLGDSCTYHGYPRLVARSLQATAPDKPVEILNFSVPGYSSYQGRKLAEQYGRAIEADVVFVYYGWNDHWLAWGQPDSQKADWIKANGRPLWSASWYRHWRALQWATKILGPWSPTAGRPLKMNRVSETEYQENLLAIASEFQASNVPVFFITAPTTHYQVGVPDYLVAVQAVESKASAVSEHRRYNNLVRQVAVRAGAGLLDWEASFNRLPELETYFWPDGIHFSDKGARVAAQSIVFTLTDSWPTASQRLRKKSPQ
jgi:lysophospholipase L1-like esterase